jgi:hypothetical protein
MLHDPKYTKWPQNRPNGHKIDHHLPLQYPPKFTQIENMPSGNSGGDVGLVGRELAGVEERADGRVPAHRKFHGQRKKEFPAAVSFGKKSFSAITSVRKFS